MIIQASTRTEAKARGLKRYFTGIACKRGHISEWLASNGGCVACMRLRKSTDDYRLQSKKWVKTYYWKNKPVQNEKSRAWAARNPERVREIWRKSYEKRKPNHGPRRDKVEDLLWVLRKEMPDLLKEFGLC